MTTNVPPPALARTGATIPAESDVIAGLQADFNAAFGGNLNLSDATPQGQIITALAAVIGANNDLFLQYVNQVDPAFSDGRMQDAIGRIYYLTRIASEPTVVTCTCTGSPGTLIPQGSLAQASDGTIYESAADATIDAGSAASVDFQAIVNGPISCPAGNLTTIYRVISGWDAITNPADGVLGRDEETRAEFEARRSASVAANAIGILPAIRGAVLAVTGVIDAYVTENSTSAPVTVGGVSIAANSLYVAVYGGTDADVAQAIWSKKPPGCAYTGTTNVTVEDTVSGYSVPLPSYTVTFTRPTGVPIYFAVSIANTSQVPSDASTQIKSAISSAFNGEDGGDRARIGSTVYALRFATAIAALGSWVRLISIAVGTTSSPADPDVATNINQVPTLDLAHIVVTLV